MNRIYQQGDVVLKVRSALPAGAKIVKPGPRGNVLAEGEATGHAHCIAPDAAILYEDATGTLWLKVDAEASLVHEEHHAQTIAPGVYEIGKVREYDPFEQSVRFVAD